MVSAILAYFFARGGLEGAERTLGASCQRHVFFAEGPRFTWHASHLCCFEVHPGVAIRSEELDLLDTTCRAMVIQRGLAVRLVCEGYSDSAGARCQVSVPCIVGTDGLCEVNGGEAVRLLDPLVGQVVCAGWCTIDVSDGRCNRVRIHVVNHGHAVMDAADNHVRVFHHVHALPRKAKPDPACGRSRYREFQRMFTVCPSQLEIGA
mmetsp:Transcript_152695/g.489767  ORF Transcript_152695/g.489767 Transcript_152695/m.489767 type:complete len:206 (+) Transcript_152695:3419-4036(+)